MSESPTIMAIATAVIVVGQVVQTILARRQIATVAAGAKQDASMAQGAADEAADRAVEVKKDLRAHGQVVDGKLDGLAKVAAATHTLVNNNMAIQLKTSAIALRRLAELTKAPSDLEAAAGAERMLAEHEVKQQTVDEKASGDAAGPGGS